jgi:hypothetical protein
VATRRSKTNVVSPDTVLRCGIPFPRLTRPPAIGDK